MTASSHTFCEDFDDPSLGTRWTKIERYGAFPALDNASTLASGV